MKLILSSLLLVLSFSAFSSTQTKTFRLFLYDTASYTPIETLSIAKAKQMDTASFVCVLANVFDPDVSYQVSSYDISIKQAGVEHKQAGLDETQLIAALKKAAEGATPAAPAIIRFTKIGIIKNGKTDSYLYGIFDGGDLIIR